MLLEEEYRRAVLHAELSWLGGVIDDLREGRLSGSGEQRRHTFEALHPPDDDEDRWKTAMIEAAALHKRYGKTTALDGVDLVRSENRPVASRS